MSKHAVTILEYALNEKAITCKMIRRLSGVTCSNRRIYDILTELEVFKFLERNRKPLPDGVGRPPVIWHVKGATNDDVMRAQALTDKIERQLKAKREYPETEPEEHLFKCVTFKCKSEFTGRRGDACPECGGTKLAIITTGTESKRSSPSSYE